MPEEVIDIPLDESRRDLLKSGVGVGLGVMGACYAGALGFPVYRYLATPAVRAAALGQITSVSLPQKDLPGEGTATMFLFGPRPSLLIHHPDGHYTAFDAVCTHLGCTVRFEPENKRIHCPCHGGVYDMDTGQVVSGPPPRALKSYRVEVADGNVTVHRA
jgi:cytochrome b6-f complex iron-sulfur subunit